MQYGNYRHALGQTNISIQIQGVQNSREQIIAEDHTWTIDGRLTSLDGGDMYQKIQALMDAYSVNGRDLLIKNINGSGTPHALYSSTCIGGTRVVTRPSFPTFGKGELATVRTYQIVVAGRVYTGGSNITEFSEQISISGGGKSWTCIEVNEGPAVRQQTRTHTKCVATQSGSMTVLLGMPQIPPPIWPSALVNEYPSVQKTGAKTVGQVGRGIQTERSVSWTYNYEFPFRLDGEPHYLG